MLLRCPWCSVMRSIPFSHVRTYILEVYLAVFVVSVCLPLPVAHPRRQLLYHLVNSTAQSAGLAENSGKSSQRTAQRRHVTRRAALGHVFHEFSTGLYEMY